MRNQFDVEMDKLHTMMIEMGVLCESGIASAVKALTEHTRNDALAAIELKDQSVRKGREIEQLCHSLLLRQQPVARDLRMVSASVKMVTDMERIGNQASDIAEIALLCHLPSDECLNTVKKMSAACAGMVTNCIDAYVHHDITLAYKLIRDDDIVDDYFDEARQALKRIISRKSELTEGDIDLLMVAKYLERIADHAVNIADWVIFIETTERTRKGEVYENLSC